MSYNMGDRAPIAPSGPDRAPIALSGPDRAPSGPDHAGRDCAVTRSFALESYKAASSATPAVRMVPGVPRGFWEGVVLLGISPELIIYFFFGGGGKLEKQCRLEGELYFKGNSLEGKQKPSRPFKPAFSPAAPLLLLRLTPFKSARGFLPPQINTKYAALSGHGINTACVEPLAFSCWEKHTLLRGCLSLLVLKGQLSA